MSAPQVANAGVNTQSAVRWAGLFVRRERWGLSWRGKLLGLALVVILFVGTVRVVHPFLAITERVSPVSGPDVLVVDGWISISSLKRAAAEFSKGFYDLVVVVRTPPETREAIESAAQWGDYMANILVEQGVPRERVRTTFSPVERKDRTYHSALAVKQTLANQHVVAGSITVATAGTHARRSRLLYEKAFESKLPVGVVSLEDDSYDPGAWWRSSEGVKEVISECFGYLYARLFFSPQ